MWREVMGRRRRRRKKLLRDLKEKQDTVNWKKKHKITLCGELALEEAIDLSQDGQQKWMQKEKLLGFSSAFLDVCVLSYDK